MKKNLAFLILLLLAAPSVFGWQAVTATNDKIVTFRFQPGRDMFVLKGNEAELERLYTLVDEFRDQIADGTIPLCVDGYCASLPTPEENLRTAFVRSNRVKSELITRKGLKEADFVTANHAEAYGGNPDVVVVTLRIPVRAESPAPQPKAEPEPEPVAEPVPPVADKQPAPAPEPVAEPVKEATPEPIKEPAPEPAPESAKVSAPAKPYCFAVRTNVLYDAMLLPTLGVEWRISRNVGIVLDASRSCWGDEHGKVQKMWMLSPEVRWYLLRNKRLYAGVAGNYGECNIYKYPLGSLLSKDHGYQGNFWNAGLTVGYQLGLSRSFSVDFNLGLGYTRFEYDTFGVTDGVRVYKTKDVSKNLWGPTQAGISLIWTIGGNK